MRAALGFSTQWPPRQAVSEAWEGIRRAWGENDAGAPSAVFAVATAAWGASALVEMAEAVRTEGWGHPVGVGASVEGVRVGGQWLANQPALALLALEGVEAHSLSADEVPGRERSVALEWAAELPAQGSGPGDLMITVVDGLRVAGEPLLEGMAEHLPGLATIGFGATEPPGGPALVWSENEILESGCAGLFLRTSGSPRIEVVHEGQVLCDPIPITRSRGSWVYGLGGRPALEVLAQHQSPESGHSEPLWVGLLEPDSPRGTAPESLVIRNVAGTDPATASFCVPGPFRTGMNLVFFKPAAPSSSRLETGSTVTAAGAGSGPEVCTVCLTNWAGEDASSAAAPVDRERIGVAPWLGVSAAYQWARSSGQLGPPLLHTHSSVMASLKT